MRMTILFASILVCSQAKADSWFEGFAINLKDVPPKVLQTAIEHDQACKNPIDAGNYVGTRMYVIDCGKLQHNITSDGTYINLFVSDHKKGEKAKESPQPNVASLKANGQKRIWPCSNNGPDFTDEAMARRAAISTGKEWAKQSDAFYCLSKGRVFDEQLTEAAAKALSISHPHGDLIRSKALKYLIEANADPKKIRDIIIKLSTFNDINTERESCRLLATLACFDCDARPILKSWTSHSKASISKVAKDVDAFPNRCKVGRDWYFVREPAKCS